MSAIDKVSLNTWTPETPPDNGADLARKIESGNVLHFPNLKFQFQENEKQFLDARWSNGSAKNISLAKDGAPVKGASGPAEQLEDLGKMIARYRQQSSNLVR